MMDPGSFMCVTEMFVSHGQTPAVWPEGRRLSSTGGPLSPSARLRTGSASWTALLKLASVPLNEAGWGVTMHGASQRARPLLGSFAPQQRLRPSGRAKQGARLPGRNPATQETPLT